PHSPTPPFRFLSIFDWSLHKGWDVLLEAFCAEFGGNEEIDNCKLQIGEAGAPVELWIKSWSSNHLALVDIREQADAFLRDRLGRGLDGFPSVHLWQEAIPEEAMPRLYR